MARPKEIKDADIIATARACFLEHGPSASTGTIAKQLGISQATLFKRFGTKEDLLIAALVPESPAWVRLLEGGPDSRPIPTQLREIVGEMATFMQDVMPRIQCLASAGIGLPRAFRDHQEPPPLFARRKLTEWFAMAMEQDRVAQGSPATAATALMGSVHAASFLLGQLCAAKQPRAEAQDPRAYLDELVALMWRGLCPDGEQP